MAVFNTVDLDALISDGGYGGLAVVSPSTIALLLSALPFISSHYLWSGSGYQLTQAEIDKIDEWAARAAFELENSMIGSIFPFAGALIPNGTLLCDGTQYARMDYPELWAVLDAVFIVDPDSFIVPDLSDKFILGTGTNNQGDIGGNFSIALSVGDLPSHNHSYNQHSITPVTIGAGAPVAVYTPPDLPASTGNTGSGNSIDITNPFMALAFVIVAGR